MRVKAHPSRCTGRSATSTCSTAAAGRTRRLRSRERGAGARHARGLGGHPARRTASRSPSGACAARDVVGAGTTVDVEDESRRSSPASRPGSGRRVGELRTGDSYAARVYVPAPDRRPARRRAARRESSRGGPQRRVTVRRPHAGRARRAAAGRRRAARSTASPPDSATIALPAPRRDGAPADRRLSHRRRRTSTATP